MSWAETKLLMDDHDEILEKLNNGLGVVKSIQRGVHNYTAATNPLTININAVNMNKTIIIVEGTTTMFGNGYPIEADLLFYFASSTQLVVYTNMAMSGRSLRWAIVEFY